MAPSFATDADIELAFAAAPSLLAPGEVGYRRQRERATDLVTADLARRWYRQEAARRGIDWRRQPLDPTRLEAAQLLGCCVHKTLALLFDAARAVTPGSDGFERNAARCQEDYEAEVRRVIQEGVRYDWNASGSVDGQDDVRPRRPLRLVRS
ncbi:MAG: hypothetical protein LDL27_11415 [Desulfovibrio sp.]|nr:hypothetical protein [Desulfovibrio sp.]